MGAPALLDAQASRVLDQLNTTANWLYNHVIGGVVTDGGTTQATGASGVFNLDLDVSQIVDCVVQGTPIEKAALADIDATAGAAVVWGATSGKALIAAVVLKQDATYEVVVGAVADTGDQVAPTDAEILTAIGDSDWVRLVDVTFTRTADTTVTVVVDHTVRPSVTSFTGDLHTSERAIVAARSRTQPLVQDPPPSE